MTDASLRDRIGPTAFRAVVVFFAAVGLAGAAAQVRAEGVAAAGDVAVTLYVTGLLLYGVFADAWGTTRFRVALYAGVLLWGLVDYATGDAGGLTPVLIGGGAALLAWTVAGAYRDRSRPVYER